MTPASQHLAVPVGLELLETKDVVVLVVGYAFGRRQGCGRVCRIFAEEVYPKTVVVGTGHCAYERKGRITHFLCFLRGFILEEGVVELEVGIDRVLATVGYLTDAIPKTELRVDGPSVAAECITAGCKCRSINTSDTMSDHSSLFGEKEVTACLYESLEVSDHSIGDTGVFDVTETHAVDVDPDTRDAGSISAADLRGGDHLTKVFVHKLSLVPVSGILLRVLGDSTEVSLRVLSRQVRDTGLKKQERILGVDRQRKESCHCKAINLFHNRLL